MRPQTWRLFCLMVIVVGMVDVAQKWGLAELIYGLSKTQTHSVAEAAANTGCDPQLLWALHVSECDLADQSDCVSSAGAIGPFQFLPTTWVMYAESGWDIWNYEDSAKAACQMIRTLEIDTQPTRDAFATRFSGRDGGYCWNCGVDGFMQALNVWDMWKNADG